MGKAWLLVEDYYMSMFFDRFKKKLFIRTNQPYMPYSFNLFWQQTMRVKFLPETYYTCPEISKKKSGVFGFSLMCFNIFLSGEDDDKILRPSAMQLQNERDKLGKFSNLRRRASSQSRVEELEKEHEEAEKQEKQQQEKHLAPPPKAKRTKKDLNHSSGKKLIQTKTHIIKPAASRSRASSHGHYSIR